MVIGYPLRFGWTITLNQIKTIDTSEISFYLLKIMIKALVFNIFQDWALKHFGFKNIETIFTVTVSKYWYWLVLFDTTFHQSLVIVKKLFLFKKYIFILCFQCVYMRDWYAILFKFLEIVVSDFDTWNHKNTNHIIVL